MNLFVHYAAAVEAARTYYVAKIEKIFYYSKFLASFFELFKKMYTFATIFIQQKYKKDDEENTITIGLRTDGM